ncbi:hypothetical protein BA895_18035 [Humibacillus sp. DSM 29435]|uniref:hypothetical protein n=1 Tax=Humibacillus sp. DSM 29435 TaxID=1869167 RepID=UPI000872429D|nr:hypothetical protein [Humibacillus sp. DSM 29435]OFE17072.1 hypothetical protein BA895_18035 [Humibacillus sp. DSM 29435]
MGQPPLTSDAARPESRARRLLSVVGIVLLALVGLWALGRFDASSSTDAAPLPSRSTPPVSTVSPDPTASGVEPSVTLETALPPFGGVALDYMTPGAALTSRDLPAVFDAWTVVVRRDDGSLGHHGAVVTYPVPAAPRENRNRVSVGPVDGVATAGQIVWPVGGQYARVRGDLSLTVLAQIAATTRVVDGRPQVAPPLRFTVISRSPSRMPLVHQLRYYQGALGMTYTGLARGGSFEDALYAGTVTLMGKVNEAPAVASTVGGGNGTVAWEPSPGLVAYVGWSGAPLSKSTEAAAFRLAQSSRILSAREWLTLGPQLIDQPNDIASP